MSVCESVFTHLLKTKQLVFDLEPPLPAFFHLFGFTLKNDGGGRACMTSFKLCSDYKPFFSELIISL